MRQILTAFTVVLLGLSLAACTSGIAVSPMSPGSAAAHVSQPQGGGVNHQ